MATREVSRSSADIKIVKRGSSGRPTLEVSVSDSTPIDRLSAALQKGITRNVDLRKKFGLGACPACISGFDIFIRDRFEEVMKVNL